MAQREDKALSPIQADCGRHQADAQWSPATRVRRGLARSQALVALFLIDNAGSICLTKRAISQPFIDPLRLTSATSAEYLTTPLSIIATASRPEATMVRLKPPSFKASRTISCNGSSSSTTRTTGTLSNSPSAQPQITSVPQGNVMGVEMFKSEHQKRA